jgi:isopenicillin-N N-acyltransferase-like protein
MSQEQEEVAIVLHLRPSDGPQILMWTFAGHLGYHGMNSHGIAHFANALGGGPAWRQALPHYPVKRRILEQQSFDDVLHLLKTTPVCSSGNYVLSAPVSLRGDNQTLDVYDLEVTPEGFALFRAPDASSDDEFLVHTNHFISLRFRTSDTDARSLPDSFQRLPRIRTLVKEKQGSITLDDMKRIMSDHANHPASICRHTDDMKTVASLIAEPEHGRLHVSAGNPCEGSWAAYAFAALPQEK